MERRPYFIFGDILACAATGAAAGWLVHALIPGAWFLPLAIVAGMALGMLAGMIGGMLFSPFFGGFEIIMPAALSGMAAGMVVAMLSAMAGTGPAAALGAGGATGLACLAYTYVLQALKHGPVR